MKVNVGSHIFEIYEDNKELEKVSKYILRNINDKITYTHNEVKKIAGESIIEENNYNFQLVQKNDDYIWGSVIKKSKLYAKKFDPKDRKLNRIAIDNDELIEFTYDVRKEIVAFYTSQRFGYQEFTKVFEGLLNSLPAIEEKYYFTTSILRKGINIAHIRNEIKKIGKIETLSVEIIPPNANGDILKSMKLKGKKNLHELKQGNVTNIVTTFNSTSKSGINIDSEIINEELDKIEGLHQELSQEDVLGRGYVKVEAKGKDGTTYSTNEKELVKNEVEDDEVASTPLFFETCKKAILRVVNLLL